MFDKKVSVYAARGMTGRVKEEVVREAASDKSFLEKAGLEVLCPVEKENVQPTKQILLSSKKAMMEYWPSDKRLIREAHIVFDMSPHLNSEGCKHEVGYARYHLQKPVVRIFPKGQLPVKSSVAYFEDDMVCDSLEEAVEYAYRVHGTYWNRLLWRLKRTNRCLPKSIWHQLMEWLR